MGYFYNDTFYVFTLISVIILHFGIFLMAIKPLQLNNPIETDFGVIPKHSDSPLLYIPGTKPM
jgi:hypothetical protein